MKKLIPSYFSLVSFSLLSAISDIAVAQDPFEFYFAFEDAIGAKDTVWYVMDMQATNSPDPELGEILVDLENGAMNCWIFNSGPAVGYKKVVFPFSPYIGFELYCNNYELPIVISYDSSLFNSAILLDAFGYTISSAAMSNQFLHLPDQDPFNMLVTDECLLAFFSFGDGYHFPIAVTMYSGEPLSVSTRNENATFELFPNPSSESTTIQSPDIIQEFILRNNVGLMIRRLQPFSERVELNLNGLAAGIYLVEVITEKGRGVQKLVVE